uniref:Formin-like protein 13 n=1 Tax=Salarias fasciatus TaxID=181472 RepID=A0A672HVC6_SALFA
MPTLGSKKKEGQPRPDKHSGSSMPQLTNEMQLSIMNKVKSGELSIEDALNRARLDGQLLRQKSQERISHFSTFYTAPQEDREPKQYNFSVHKHGRYRWQKRVLQIDFTTKLLCSIEKGIVKRQLPFSAVKSCDDGENSRFSISFKGHHDYELEATSLDDKHKIMQLVNQIIYGNIYQESAGDDTEPHQQPEAPQSLRDGVLLLHRGGLASFKWVKYEVQLHPGQLTLSRRRVPTDGETTTSTSVSVPIVIHLSHGDTTVQKTQSPDSFNLVTHKNEYWFKVPLSDQTSGPGSLQKERDAWVHAIHKLCSNWKRKSMGEHMFLEAQSLRPISIAEDPEDSGSDRESGGGADALLSSAGDTSPNKPTPDRERPVPTPRVRTSAPGTGPGTSPPTPTSPTAPSAAAPTSPTSPIYSTPMSPSAVAPSGPSPSSTVPVSPLHPPTPRVVKEPPQPQPFIPAPPPLPIKLKKAFIKRRTKAFHWDPVGPDKIAKSFWKQESTRRIEIDTSRLYEQFAVKDPGTFAVAEPSNTQHIMLNEKIAHNFNIFLKSFLVQPGELKDKLFVINEEDGGLSDEHITSLRRYVPTVEDVEMYKSHKGPVSELHIVDQYMLALINQKIRMCTQLYNCGSFVSVLEYLLAIGNYLNENAGKGKAKGFRLSSLPKLSQLRGTDKKFTLLHALVEQIMLHEPKLAAFTQDLAEFETVPGASIKGLTAEVDVLKNELKKVVEYRKTTKKRNAGAPHPNFFKDLKAVIDKYEADLSALTKTCEEMKKLYSVILVKFGEPADQDSQELFGMICQFVQDFRGTQAEAV